MWPSLIYELMEGMGTLLGHLIPPQWLAAISTLLMPTPFEPGGAGLPPVTTCLRCGQPLIGRRYADQRLERWVICPACYAAQSEGEQRHYVVRES